MRSTRGGRWRSRPFTTRHLLLLLGAVWLLRLATLGVYPLIDSTEGRYADVAREMVRSGSWVMPPLDPGVPFWAKPPLAFWAQGISFEVFGLNAFAARLPGFLFCLLTAGVVAAAGWRMGGSRLGLLAAAVFSSTVLTFAMSAAVMMDPPLALFTTIAGAAFLRHLEACGGQQPGGEVPRRWGWLFFAAAGFAVLAKGLVGAIIPGLAVALWVALGRRIGPVLRLPWLTGPALFLAVAVPWHLLAEQASPGFLDYYIVGEHFRRFAEHGWKGDLFGNPPQAARGMVWLFLAGALLPWSLLAPWAARRRRWGGVIEADGHLLFCLCWMLAPAVLFTLARNSAIAYVLPSLPPAALLAAAALLRLRSAAGGARAAAEGGRVAPRRRLLLAPAAVAALVLVPLAGNAFVLTVLPHIAANRSQREVARFFLGRAGESDAELVYYDDMPQSADFYTDGRADHIPDKQRQRVLEESSDGAPDMFAVDDDDLPAFRQIGATRRYRLVGVIGEYSLFLDPEF